VRAELFSRRLVKYVVLVSQQQAILKLWPRLTATLMLITLDDHQLRGDGSMYLGEVDSLAASYEKRGRKA